MAEFKTLEAAQWAKVEGTPTKMLVDHMKTIPSVATYTESLQFGLTVKNKVLTFINGNPEVHAYLNNDEYQLRKQYHRHECMLIETNGWGSTKSYDENSVVQYNACESPEWVQIHLNKFFNDYPMLSGFAPRLGESLSEYTMKLYYVENPEQESKDFQHRRRVTSALALATRLMSWKGDANHLFCILVLLAKFQSLN